MDISFFDKRYFCKAREKMMCVMYAMRRRGRYSKNGCVCPGGGGGGGGMN